MSNVTEVQIGSLFVVKCASLLGGRRWPLAEWSSFTLRVGVGGPSSGTAFHAIASNGVTAAIRNGI